MNASSACFIPISCSWDTNLTVATQCFVIVISKYKSLNQHFVGFQSWTLHFYYFFIAVQNEFHWINKCIRMNTCFQCVLIIVYNMFGTFIEHFHPSKFINIRVVDIVECCYAWKLTWCKPTLKNLRSLNIYFILLWDYLPVRIQ